MTQRSARERQLWFENLRATLRGMKDRWWLRADRPINRMRCWLITTVALSLLPHGLRLSAEPAQCAAIGNAHMLVEGNAPIVLLQFRRQNGTTRKAHFVFDSGGGAVLLDETLASDLGLKSSGAEITDSGNGLRPLICDK